MTKYEWESELKKNIHRLPAAEIKRVLEYYDELFADKIERGKGETEIIGEFGNPVDVADKILSEYDGELTEEAPKVAPPTAETREPKAEEKEPAPAEEKKEEPSESKGDDKPEEKKEKESGELRLGRLVAFVLVNALTGFAFFILVASVWIVAISMVASVASILIGGAFGAVSSVITMFTESLGSGVAQLGMSIATFGIGILLAVLMDKVVIWLGKSTVKFFKWLKNWLTARRKTHEKA